MIAPRIEILSLILELDPNCYEHDFKDHKNENAESESDMITDRLLLILKVLESFIIDARFKF